MQGENDACLRFGKRLGAAGLSMSGEWTMWSAACDLRLKAAVVSGWMCTTEGVFSVPNCACWELPGLVELMEICEVHLLIAPRPVLFESAERDNCFPIQYTRQGFQRIRAGYQVFGAEDQVRQDTWPAGHEWHGKVAYSLIDQALGGHAAMNRRPEGNTTPCFNNPLTLTLSPEKPGERGLLESLRDQFSGFETKPNRHQSNCVIPLPLVGHHLTQIRHVLPCE